MTTWDKLGCVNTLQSPWSYLYDCKSFFLSWTEMYSMEHMLVSIVSLTLCPSGYERSVVSCHFPGWCFFFGMTPNLLIGMNHIANKPTISSTTCGLLKSLSPIARIMTCHKGKCVEIQLSAWRSLSVTSIVALPLGACFAMYCAPASTSIIIWMSTLAGPPILQQ